jgi:hypothetical protein
VTGRDYFLQVIRGIAGDEERELVKTKEKTVLRLPVLKMATLRIQILHNWLRKISDFVMGTASARRTGLWPLDLRILNRQPLDLKTTRYMF